MNFKIDDIITLEPKKPRTIYYWWGPNGDWKVPSGGFGDRGPVIATVYPFAYIGENRWGNVQNGWLEVLKQGVVFFGPSEAAFQHYNYTITVINNGPVPVSFQICGTFVS